MKNTLALGLLVAVALIIFAVQIIASRWLTLTVLGVAALVLIFAFHIAA